MTKSRSNATAPAAKGELVIGTGTDASGILSVGANDTVLTADSSTSTGLKWAAPSASFTGAAVYKSTSQSISNTTNTVITWDSENIDVGGCHDNSTNNSRITVPSGKGGYYFLHCNIGWQTNASGRRILRFLKNGNYLFDGTTNITSQFPGNAEELSQQLTLIASASAGDYFEMQCYQTSGGNLNINAGNSFFSAYLIGA